MTHETNQGNLDKNLGEAQILSEGGRNHLKGGGAQKKDPP